MALVQRGSGIYYYRSARRGGRVTSEYLGSGEAARLMATLDTAELDQREGAEFDRREALRRQDAADAVLDAWSHDVELLARAALVAAGYRRHKRGEWRKRRERAQGPDPGQA